VRARPSRRADDGSHRFHTRNACAVCHRAGRRPIPHGTAVIASAFRAPRGIRAVAPGSRGATRGQTFDSARRPRGRPSGVRPRFRSSAQAEVAPEACSPADTAADTTAGAGNRHAHAGQRHLGRSRRAARPDPAANSRRQGQGESEGAREGQANGQAPRARAAGRARGDDDDDNDDAAAGGGVRAARGREGSWQRQGEGPRQRARRVVPVRG
jgi:hypothetical protein